jgi:hypothetical protein
VAFAESFLSAKLSTSGKGFSLRESPLSAKTLNPVVLPMTLSHAYWSWGDKIDVPMALVSILQVLGEDRSPKVAYICYLFCRYSRLHMDNKIDNCVLVCTYYRADRSIK